MSFVLGKGFLLAFALFVNLLCKSFRFSLAIGLIDARS
jgi:hypothetical protein